MSEADRKKNNAVEVLQYIEMRANATVAEISRGTGLRQHVVRRIVGSLLEKKLIYRYVHLNVYSLGFFEIDLFVSLRDQCRKAVDRVVRWCCAREDVCFLAEIIGRYDLKIGLTVRSMEQVHKFVETACHELDFPFARKEIVTVMELFDFGVHKATSRATASLAALRFGFGGQFHALDPDDHKILQILSRQPDLTPTRMAHQSGLSPSTFAYRIQRLEKAGVIAGYRYLFDPSGKTTEYFHGLLSLGGVSAASRKEMYNFCATHPQIPFFAETSGSFDFLFCMAVKRSADTLPIIRTLHQAMEPHAHSISVEVYGSANLVKLAKYPFNSMPFDKE